MTTLIILVIGLALVLYLVDGIQTVAQLLNTVPDWFDLEGKE